MADAVCEDAGAKPRRQTQAGIVIGARRAHCGIGGVRGASRTT
jgi:hypothetical protein